MPFKTLLDRLRKAHSGTNSASGQRSDVGNGESTSVSPKPFDADDIPIPVSVFESRQDKTGIYLMRDGDQPALLLNETGLRIWQLCDGITSTRQIVNSLRRTYDGDESVLHSEALAALLAFEKHGLLRRGRLPADATRPQQSNGPQPRHKVYGVGYTFRPIWSSNSCRKPMRFDWTSRRDDATVPVTICIGHEILRGIELPGRKIAWLIESPALSQGIHRFIEGNLDQVLDAFELILTPDRSLCALDPKIRYHPAGSNLPWIATEDYGIYPKTKLCSMIASAKTMVAGHNARQEYARMLKDRIDLFGGACGSPKIMGERTHFDKREGLVPYMFSVTMENCKVDFYYTEKIMDCFVTGTVPIYWGSHAIGELFDEKGIIRLDEDFEPESISEELYYSMMPYIKHNFEVAKNIEGADDLLFNRYIRQYA